MTTEQIRAAHNHGELRHIHYYVEGDNHDHAPQPKPASRADVQAELKLLRELGK